MRGAALKIGQMLSIQDETVLPPEIQSALERVRAGADVMPRWQLEKQLTSQLGVDWVKQVAEFDWEPKAAASIGQVHSARLWDGRQVAMKVQYPGRELGGGGGGVNGNGSEGGARGKGGRMEDMWQ